MIEGKAHPHGPCPHRPHRPKPSTGPGRELVDQAPKREWPVLVGLGLVAALSLVAACFGWEWILSRPAH